MNDDRNQGRTVKPQAQQTHPEEWQRDLNPDHLAGQNIGPPSVEADEGSAFHLRKRGVKLPELDDDELKQVPVLAAGARLHQGATYLDLMDDAREEFTATGNMVADGDHAYAPKAQVPYEIWNRLRGEAKP